MELTTLSTGSKSNCYILQNNESALIIEAGVRKDEVLRVLDYDTSKIQEVLISHQHGDHAKYQREITSLVPAAFRIAFRVSSFRVQHDCDNQGFFIHHPDIGNLMYLTDAYYIPIRPKGLNHLLVEANYSEDILSQNVEKGYLNPGLARRIRENHLSIERLEHWLRLIDTSQLKTVILCHLSDGNSNEEDFKKRIQKITGVPVYIAEKNQKLIFPVL